MQEGSYVSASHVEDLQDPGICEDVISWLCDFKTENIPRFPGATYNFANDDLISNVVCKNRVRRNVLGILTS